MRIVIQRVTDASVSIGGKLKAAIGAGMMVLIGVENGDTEADALWLAAKTASLRIFDDSQGVMNLDIKAVGGEILAISQFTLTASTRKGNRPSYIRAARQPLSTDLYELYCTELRRLTGTAVPTGTFGADMQVSLTNDGPVTIIIDSKLKE
ncbi:MAG: D-tyrosyl-tRNA(Tyr) deacylase [Muribaculaceae bacterium]|nr:D-tyrosyl-tRNA(Tyr) deacylase [Muribaculaceae bacterium]